MPTVQRGAKAAGGTAFVTGTVASATEVNTDFDTIYNEYNSTIGNGIEQTSVDGLSDTPTERRTETSPGVTGSESDATTLAGEVERLRYKLHELGLGISTVRNTTASGDDTYWIDTPQMGPNLIRNGNFAIGLESSVPPGWTNVNTATLALTTAGKTEGHASMRALRITAAGGTDEGVSQTLAGLKASTKYVVGCRAKATSGDTFKLTTTGADGSTFGNLTLTTTSTTYVTLAGVIVTDSTPTDIVVSLLAAADTDVVDVTHVWVRECATDKLPMSSMLHAYGQTTTDTANHFTASSFTDSGITGITIVPPAPGYVIEVEAQLTVSSANNGHQYVVQIRENGTGVVVAYGTVQVGNGVETKALRYVNRTPTPGTTYTYTLFATGLTNALGLNLGEAVGFPINAETNYSYIRARAFLASGGH